MLIIRNLIKFCFWYGIPFIIDFSSHTIRLLDSFGITSLSVMIAAVLPTPAGVGAVEYIMTMLFAVVLGNGKAGAVTILYRIATFIFPFLVGFICITISRIVGKKEKYLVKLY